MVGKGKGKANSHNGEYWARLRKQFKTCHYDQSGAYAAQRQIKSQAMTELQTRLDNTEQNLQSATYQHLKNTGNFYPRTSDRLLVHLTKLTMSPL